LAVVGLGGIGKTQVVLSFVYAIREEHPDISIVWVPALSVETFSQAMKEVAGRLGIHIAEGSDQDVRPLVKQRLSAPNAGKWLLVVDNADDFDVVNSLLQFLPISDEGITVFTTRTAKVAQQVARSNVITLQKPAQDEAKELLRKALVREQDLGDVESTNTLLAELDCLPLAITQAAGYLNINSIPISEYVRLLQSADQENLVYLMKTEIRDNTRYEQAASAVATTWIVSFRQIVATDRIAADLLQFMSCIEWKAIPYSLLPTVEPEARTRNAIGTLQSYYFLSTRADGRTYDMHRLVHLASRIWARDSGRTAEIQAEAAAHVSMRFPKGEWEDRETWRAYMPHAERLRSQWLDVNTDRESDAETRIKSQICTRVGFCLYQDGRIKDAVQWMQISSIMTSRLSQDDPDRLVSQHALALVYQANGQVPEAVQLLESVVKIRSRILVEEHPDRLASQHVLAGAYQANGQVTEAVQLLENVVKIRSRTLVEEHPDRLASQHELARAYQANGQVTEAVQLLEGVVKIKSRILVEEHPSRLTSQHALTGAYQVNGQVTEAVQLLEGVVKIKSRTLVEEHPDRLASQHALALVYQANGQVPEAVQLLEGVVKIRSRTLVAEHPDRLASQHELARAYQANGQVTEAVQLLENVVKIRSRTLVEEHPSRLASQHALAGAYQANGQVTEAVQLLENVVKIRSRILVEEHPSRLASQHALTGAYKANGQVSEAVQLLESVVKIRSRILVEEHPSRLASQHNLALMYDEEGQTDKAVRLLEKVVATYVGYAIEHPHRLISQQELLRMYEQSGDPEKAAQLRNDIVVTEELLAAKYSKDHTLPYRSAPDVDPQLPHKKEDVSKDRRWKRGITRLFRPQG
jgi:tetratricopeptide (TPR) repeat protein